MQLLYDYHDDFEHVKLYISTKSWFIKSNFLNFLKKATNLKTIQFKEYPDYTSVIL